MRQKSNSQFLSHTSKGESLAETLDVSYGGFYRLRSAIASVVSAEFGKYYGALFESVSDQQQCRSFFSPLLPILSALPVRIIYILKIDPKR